MIAVNADEDPRYLEFTGSPTIRIDGQDIHTPAEHTFGLRRREYPADDGHGSTAVPGKRLIRRAIERARGWGHGRRD